MLFDVLLEERVEVEEDGEDEGLVREDVLGDDAGDGGEVLFERVGEREGMVRGEEPDEVEGVEGEFVVVGRQGGGGDLQVRA